VAASRIVPAPPERPVDEHAGGSSAERERGASDDAGAPRDAQTGAAFLKRAEVRDVLAWLRLLVDPRDAGAVVRALARPPIELRQVELARAIQAARRHRLDLVLGLRAATESTRVPPEARERIQRFVALHASAAAELDRSAPDEFVSWLIRLLHGHGRPLLAAGELAEQRSCLERLHALAAEYTRAAPLAGTRGFVRHLATVSATPKPEVHSPEMPRELHEVLALLREEVLEDLARIGGRLGELRLDTELDVAHGVVRYLELLKVSALLQRAPEQSLDEALADVNARLLAAATPLQREILLTSTFDRTLGAEGAGAVGEWVAGAIAPREQHSLGPFLPRRGDGLALSASDVQTYRSCPLRYKYARVLRIPSEQTVHQRFGIVVHQVLERYHSEGGETLAQLLELLDTCWRRAGFGGDGVDRELLEKARVALTRYHARLRSQDAQPVWFERQFSFRLGPHHVRGRVDRVDRRGVGADATYELIDYKTSRAKTVEQLHDDVQLPLYALAARRDWQLPSSRQAYHYVLDDLVVPVPERQANGQSVEEVVLAVGDGILAQEFEPTPSPAACATCDYAIVCPVAEG